MCGIFGIISGQGESIVSKELLSKISKLLERRGPNHVGYAFYRNTSDTVRYENQLLDRVYTYNLLLLHRRLSILDLSSFGDQPMLDNTGRYALVFNGEIYNFLSLRKNLHKLGYAFKSNTDTEVLLYHLIHYGIQGVTHLEGMYAFAFFDKKLKKVFIARDPFGIKPCYIFKGEAFIAFSSQINTLLELPGLSRKLNIDNYISFLRFGATDFNNHTLVQNIEHVLPGHYIGISFDKDILEYKDVHFFHLEEKRECAYLQFNEQKTALLNLLQQSVKQHLVSDVPLCFNLSGGVDSSALLAIAHQFKKDITAFTYVADEKEICEVKYAEMVASHLGIQLVKVRIDPMDFGKDLERIIYDQGEPYAGSSIYAQRKLYEAQSKEGFKVCIDGQGGDELFAGYNYFLAYKLQDLIREKKYICILKYLSKVGRMNMNAKLKGVLAHWFDIFLKGVCPPLRYGFRKCIGRDLRPFYLDKSFYKNNFHDFDLKKFGSLQKALEDSLLYSNIPTLLRYADRNAMAFSIENRVPFLTTFIANFAHNLPSSSLISDYGVTKYILRECIKDLLPAEIVHRKDKLGFPPTEGLWLLKNHQLITKILCSDVAASLPGVQVKKLTQYWENIVRKNDPKSFRTDIIWKIVNMIKWVELFNIKYEP